MRALQRTLLTLTALLAMAPVACVPISEPIGGRRLMSGNWKGAARLDTIRLQLVEKDPNDVNGISGTGTYSQTATGNSWPLDVSGYAYEIRLLNEAHGRRIFRVRSLEDDRLDGVLAVVAFVAYDDSRGTGVEFIVQDSMPFSLFRQQ
jgi:hypothetical protein